MNNLEELIQKLEKAKKATQTCLYDAESLVDFHGLGYWANEVERLRKLIKENL